jgi:hypothetical protein
MKITPHIAEKIQGTLVVDEQGQPLLVYRGEHGAKGSSKAQLETLLGSMSFGEIDIAAHYAESPNQRHASRFDLVPRVYPVYLAIRQPIMNRHDTFIEFPEMVEAIGEEQAKRFMIKHQGSAMNTDNWGNINDEDLYEDIRDMAKKAPELMEELYVELYHLLDDPEFVKLAKAAGYDGAIYGSSGAGAGQMEYRVFEPKAVVFALTGETCERFKMPEKEPEVEMSL